MATDRSAIIDQVVLNSAAFMTENPDLYFMGIRAAPTDIPELFREITNPDCVLLVFRTNGWIPGCKGNHDLQMQGLSAVIARDILPKIAKRGLVQHGMHIGKYEGGTSQHAYLEICTYACLIKRPQA